MLNAKNCFKTLLQRLACNVAASKSSQYLRCSLGKEKQLASTCKMYSACRWPKLLHHKMSKGINSWRHTCLQAGNPLVRLKSISKYYHIIQSAWKVCFDEFEWNIFDYGARVRIWSTLGLRLTISFEEHRDCYVTVNHAPCYEIIQAVRHQKLRVFKTG